MHEFSKTNEPALTTPEIEPETPGIRTFAQIASILAQREGLVISPEGVRQICRGAEKKCARILRADPLIDQWLTRRTARAN